VRTKKAKKDFFKNEHSFLHNSVILLTRQNKLIGTRVFGGLPKFFRFTKYMRILSVSSGTII
jgi:ribosomal protein L14